VSGEVAVEPEKPYRLLVLGLGNLLCGDDGAGPAAVCLLRRRYRAPEGVAVFDGGTLGLWLLPYIQQTEELILVDAVRTEDPPGSLVRLEGQDVGPAVRHRLSPHQIGVADLLDGALLLGCCPRRVLLLGIVPQRIDLMSVERSPTVEARLPELVAWIVEESASLGYRFEARDTDETPHVGDPVVEPRLARL
jgi:hydrogenase maturation protease